MITKIYDSPAAERDGLPFDGMTTAAAVAVAEVEEIVASGSADPDCIHTPGIYVDPIVLSTINEKSIEKLTVRQREVE